MIVSQDRIRSEEDANIVLANEDIVTQVNNSPHTVHNLYRRNKNV